MPTNMAENVYKANHREGVDGADGAAEQDGYVDGKTRDFWTNKLFIISTCNIYKIYLQNATYLVPKL